MAPHKLSSGQVIDGKYRLSTELGAGGMGTVWMAEQLNLGAPVALKVVGEEHLDDEVALARFMGEAKASALLRSPHIVQVFDYGHSDGLTYIVMERLEGESLRQRLRNEKQLSPAVTATIITHVGRAMTKAHDSSIIHRDLKPSNIFLVENDDDFVAKVLDFGVAKSLNLQLDDDGTPKTRTGSMLGTPYYMSPEQAQGQSSVDHRTDLWAMGVIAFECLTGQLPFSGDTIGDLVLKICARPLPTPSQVSTVPKGFDDWFATAVSRDLTTRFSSAKELTNSLRAILVPNAGEITFSDEVDEFTEEVESAPMSALNTRTSTESELSDLDVEAPTERSDELLRQAQKPPGTESGQLRSLDAAIVDAPSANAPSTSTPSTRRRAAMLIAPLLFAAAGVSLWLYGSAKPQHDAATPSTSPNSVAPTAIKPPSAAPSSDEATVKVPPSSTPTIASVTPTPSASVKVSPPPKTAQEGSPLPTPPRLTPVAPSPPPIPAPPPPAVQPPTSSPPPTTPPPAAPVVPSSTTEKPENPLGI